MRERRWLAEVGIGVILAGVLMGSAGATPVSAQRPGSRRPSGPVTTPAGTQASEKGIWELVNYKQDLKLTDVFFVSQSTGWVTGEHGTLLRTTDGGETWTATLGGDPAATEDPIDQLRFIDATHGWAVQGRSNLLRTTDGENWEQIGKLGEQFGFFNDYVIPDDRVGIQIVKEHNELARTQDGGKTWKKVFDLRAQGGGGGPHPRPPTAKSRCFLPLAVGGLRHRCHEFRREGLFVFRPKTAASAWTGALAVPDVANGREAYFFITNEKTGYICTSGGDLLGTDDGGQTWSGLPGAACAGKADFLFADPEVGWTFRYSDLTWTTDGGREWTARKIPLPAPVRGFSLPRRDRAYAVGDHGMAYRYRVVPVETVVAKAVDAPVMPGFPMTLATNVEQLDGQFAALDGFVQSAADAPAPAGGAASGAAGAGGDFAQSPPSAFVTGCCGKRLGALELVLKAVGGIVPDFISKYKNLNLLAQGLRTAAALPEMNDSLRNAFRSFRSAPDRATAMTALSGVKNVLATLKAAVDTALQKPAGPPGGPQ